MRVALLIGLRFLALAPGLGLPMHVASSAFAQDAAAVPVPVPMPRLHRPDAALPGGQPQAPVPDDVSALLPQTPAAVPGTPATAAISAATAVPQKVHLDARISKTSPVIQDGVVWRIFDTKTDTQGELPLVAKIDTAVADIALAPGNYVVHVAYGEAQASDSLAVSVGGGSKTLVLDAGGLRLNASIAGDIPIPPGLMKFDIYNGSQEDDHSIIVRDLAPNDIVTLNAGTYHVISRFGAVNAVARANLRVEPGQLTDATLFHKAAQVSFKLVSEPGGEAIADIEWTVKTAAGEPVFTDLGAFPSTVLAQGEYLVLAKRGTTVYNRNFEVKAGEAREIEVLTSVY